MQSAVPSLFTPNPKGCPCQAVFPLYPTGPEQCLVLLKGSGGGVAPSHNCDHHFLESCF